MKKRILRFYLEFRQAKFMNVDIPLPVFHFKKEETDIPKREDEHYER